MRKLSGLAVLLVPVALLGCAGGPAPTVAPGQTTAAGPTGGPGSTSPGPGSATGAPPASVPPASQGTGSGNVIPAACAAGFIAFLKAIEPVTAGFDPATARLGDFFTTERAVKDKGFELMDGGYASYSCSEVGLEFNYFDTRSPWPSILELAAAQAPGTVPYMQVNQQVSMIDVAQMADFGVSSCEDAVARIKQAVAGQKGAGNDSAADMPAMAGLELLGLYKAYIADVGEEACPRDVLGNDEFVFFGAIG